MPKNFLIVNPCWKKLFQGDSYRTMKVISRMSQNGIQYQREKFNVEITLILIVLCTNRWKFIILDCNEKLLNRFLY